jgi:hypothetical protein
VAEVETISADVATTDTAFDELKCYQFSMVGFISVIFCRSILTVFTVDFGSWLFEKIQCFMHFGIQLGSCVTYFRLHIFHQRINLKYAT